MSPQAGAGPVDAASGQGTVWLVEYDDYDGYTWQDVVFTTRDAAVEAVKARHPHPYIVTWEDVGDGLVGRFRAVSGYSTEHQETYGFHEATIVGPHAASDPEIAADWADQQARRAGEQR